METNNIQQGQELLTKLVEKAWESASFKEQLIANPEEVIESTLGTQLEIPVGSKIMVEDQSNKDTIYLNIPQKIQIDELELNDEQLETVSGGEGVTVATVLTYIGGAVAVAQALDWIVEGYNNYE